MVKDRGIITSAYLALRAIREVNPTFGFQVLNVWDTSKAIYGYGSGLRQGLDFSHFKRMPVAVPPLDEQNAIVRFLDWANGRLDRAIRAKRKVIALLNEQKQAITHRAVTRGLDPFVPLKPSGIPWLGDVPQHWEVVRLGGLADLITGFPFPSEGFGKSGNGIRLLRGVNVTPSGLRWKDVVYWVREPKDGLDGFAIDMGDIILGMDRPMIAGGIRVSVVEKEDLPALLLQRVARLRATSRLDARLLLLLLRGRMFREYMAPIFTGVSVPHLSPGQIRRFKIALPPPDEQLSIINSIADQTFPLESAISRLEREIDLLREFRTRLVADVVTGKLDVREAAAKLPFDEQPSDLGEELIDDDSEMIEDEITEPAE
jgi:type I restriction enzyme S subunit